MPVSRRRILASSTLVLCSVCWLYSAPRDYGSTMQATLRRSLGKDFDKYEWMSYPTNNFGIATMYVLEKERDKPGDRNQWCATFTCLGLEGKRAPADKNARLTVGGFADVGTGAPIAVSENESRMLASEVFLPGILNVLGLGGQVSIAQNARVSIKMGNVSRRVLRKDALLAYLDTLPQASPIRKALNENRLAMVVADAVIDSLEVDIDLQGGQSSELGAKLAPLVDRFSGTPSSLRVTVKRTKDSQFRLLVSQPVIIARLVMKRPLVGRDVDAKPVALPAGLDDWSSWVPIGTAKHD